MAQFRAELSAVAGETVDAFGYFTEPGYVSDTGGSGIFAIFRNRARRRREGALPLQVYLALTPTRIVAIAFERRGAEVTPTEVVRVWDRSSTEVEVRDLGDDTTLVSLRAVGEEHPTRLESTRQSAEANAALRGLRG